MPEPNTNSVVERVVHMLHQVENIVLTCIAVVLAILAILLLGSSVVAMWNALMSGQIRDLAIDILDGVLLVMMTMEIVYTVALSLESHSLVAEPFLIVALAASIYILRRARYLRVTSRGDEERQT